jgi:Tfp pilus assembly PilM family ATPase
VRAGLQIVLDTIVSEMRKAMEYHLTSRKTHVSRIVLCGGGAYLPEFSGYLSQVFGGIEVIVGDPFASAKPGPKVTIPRERAVYSVCVGLSQRVF